MQCSRSFHTGSENNCGRWRDGQDRSRPNPADNRSTARNTRIKTAGDFVDQRDRAGNSLPLGRDREDKSAGKIAWLVLQIDGARFANALASIRCSPADLTWRAGVDALSFGGTKNGLGFGEAIVFFEREVAQEFAYRMKQSGQLASKMRFLSAPWLALLKDGLWLERAKP